MGNLPVLSLKKKPSPQVTIRRKRTVQTKPISAGELHARLCHGSLAHVAPVFGQYRPLQVGIWKEFRKRMVPVLTEQWPVMNKAERLRVLFRVLRRHTALRAYLEAAAAPGSQRHDFDGHPVEPVLEEHREQARAQLQEKVEE
ncbi:MAG: ProQ/FINO family protein [Acidithiobacillus sp.]|nr:ProQ/FINO family protein [Acidithiobacillus sp.]